MKTYRVFKHSIIFLILLSFTVLIKSDLAAQDKKSSEKDIPVIVLESFVKLYPDAIITGYEVENEKGKTTYEIESTEGLLKRDVEFTGSGNVIEIGEFIPINTLPSNVVSSIENKFNKARIINAEKKTRGSEISYEMVIEDKNRKHEVHMNLYGDLINDDDNGNDNDD